MLVTQSAQQLLLFVDYLFLTLKPVYMNEPSTGSFILFTQPYEPASLMLVVLVLPIVWSFRWVFVFPSITISCIGTPFFCLLVVSYVVSFVIYPVPYWNVWRILIHTCLILSATVLVMALVYIYEREQRQSFIKIRNLQLQQDAIDAEAKRTSTLLEKYVFPPNCIVYSQKRL